MLQVVAGRKDIDQCISGVIGQTIACNIEFRECRAPPTSRGQKCRMLPEVAFAEIDIGEFHVILQYNAEEGVGVSGSSQTIA